MRTVRFGKNIFSSETLCVYTRDFRNLKKTRTMGIDEIKRLKNAHNVMKPIAKIRK